MESTTFQGTATELAPAKLSDNARTVLAKRYLKKDEAGNPVESPETMFWRVAYAIASAETLHGASEDEIQTLALRFYDLMTSGLFEPNSPTLMNAGRPLGQLSACFVLPVEDTIRNGKDGIYDTLSSMAAVHKSGGGTGFSFSRLRPSGAQVRSTTGVASGPVSFMRLYDASTDVVKQGGTRRGANMGILRVDHPDIREFITCKSDVSQITNFNISVAITHAFMAAVKAGDMYPLRDPRDGAIVGYESAREIFDLIVEGAWATGEPGVFFIDRANQYNPVPALGSYEATNPCGEQPLLPYDVCNLGSINVGAFVREDAPAAVTASEKVDWQGLREVVHLSTRFLDNVIDANNYPLPEIHELVHSIRRIGLGIMGFADLLVRVGLPYGSEESIEFARELMRFIDEESKAASEELAATRGVFPAWEKSIWGPDATCARDANGKRIRQMRRLRNCNTTTVAPTGTISMIANCSGGIEPLFAVAFMRNQAGVMMPDVNADFVRVAKEQGWYSDDLMRRIAEEGHIHFAEVPEAVQRVFTTTHDVTPEQHVRMQAAFQEFVDSAISKTCNFAESATREDVRSIYMMAFELGCKGVTVYRNGSRPNQVLSTGKTSAVEDQIAKLGDAHERIHQLEGELAEARAALAAARPTKRTRPEALRGLTFRQESPLGTVYITVNEDEQGRPFEVFTTLGKAGGAAMADAEALGRTISLSLRSGVALQDIFRELRGIACDRPIGFGPNKVLSMPDAVAIAIGKYLQMKEGVQESLPLPAPQAVGAPPAENRDHEALAGACPDCSSELIFMEGCKKCHCGYSACS